MPITTVAFNFVGLFLYVAAAPVFIIEHLHLSERERTEQPSAGGVFVARPPMALAA